MTKLNPTTMKTQYDGQYDTFCRKNHDYGNSFEESLDQFGIIASLVRMQDKMLRLQSLTDESKTQQVGSESLLDTLEDLSNYAAMTACWLRGIRGEDGETSCGPDMIDVIKYNVQDAKNVMSRSAEMEKEFNKHIPSKVENIDPRNYVLNMLSNIFRVVQTKIDKDVMLVPMDISDEAGLIAKAIVESQTEEEGCNRAKAKDKARANKVIVMASRGSGKVFMKARSLLKELGIPEEDIKEIFEGLEEEDDE